MPDDSVDDDPDDPVRVHADHAEPRPAFPDHGPGEDHPPAQSRAAALSALVALDHARRDEQAG